MFKGKIGCVVAAKAAARSCHFIYTGFALRQRYQLIVQHQVIPDMIFYPLMDGCPVVPTQPVNTIRAIYFNQPSFTYQYHAINQFKIFVFEIAPHRGGKRITGQPRVPKASTSMSMLKLGLYHLWRCSVIQIRLKSTIIPSIAKDRFAMPTFTTRIRPWREILGHYHKTAHFVRGLMGSRYGSERFTSFFAQVESAGDCRCFETSAYQRQPASTCLFWTMARCRSTWLKYTVERLWQRGEVAPVIIACVHAADRMQEYGVAAWKIFCGRGSRAAV